MKKILVVDDNKVFRKIIGRQITNFGYEFIAKNNGTAALTFMADQGGDIGLILLDQTMPDLTGMETFLELKEGLADLPPIVMITAHDSLNLALAFIKAGGDDFLVKPVDPDLLNAKIQKAFQHQKQKPRKALNPIQELQAFDQVLGFWHSQDPWHRKQWWSRGLFSLTGYIPGELKPGWEGWKKILDGPTLAAMAQLKQTPKDGDRFQVRGRLKTKAGQERAVLICGHAQRDQPDGHLWWRGTLTALDQDKAAEDGLELDALMQKMPLATLVVQDGCLVFYSAQALPFFRKPPNLGKKIDNAVVDLLTEGTVCDRFPWLWGQAPAELFLLAKPEPDEAPETTKPQSKRSKLGLIIGSSQTMQAVYDLVMQTARSESAAMIYGASGTGKELVARTIHNLSNRGGLPFVAVNCGAIPENLFESEFFGYKKGAFTGADANKPGFFDLAHRGSLFLDEIGDLSLEMQVKLLRALDQNGYIPVGGRQLVKSDVRIIAATNRSLSQRVKSGHFREDLFYRINVITIHLPTLKERIEDIPALVTHILANQSEGPFTTLGKKHLEALKAHHWPGNIRELINVLRRFRATGKLRFHSEDGQSESLAATQSLAEAVKAFEKEKILEALNLYGWNRSQAAASLGVPERTFYRKMKSHGMIT